MAGTAVQLKMGVGWTGESFREHVKAGLTAIRNLLHVCHGKMCVNVKMALNKQQFMEALREQNGTAITISLCRDCHPYHEKKPDHHHSVQKSERFDSTTRSRK